MIRSLRFDQSIQPAQLLQQLAAGGMEEQGSASGVLGGAAAASEAPLILLNGHVCALAPETLSKELHGNEQTGFELREPYEWESDGEATGFLLPRWMWGVVGGEAVSVFSCQTARGQGVHVGYCCFVCAPTGSGRPVTQEAGLDRRDYSCTSKYMYLLH